MNFKSYPKAKDTASRRTRKGLRNSVFQFNYKIKARLKREQRAEKALTNDNNRGN